MVVAAKSVVLVELVNRAGTVIASSEVDLNEFISYNGTGAFGDAKTTFRVRLSYRRTQYQGELELTPTDIFG